MTEQSRDISDLLRSPSFRRHLARTISKTEYEWICEGLASSIVDTIADTILNPPKPTKVDYLVQRCKEAGIDLMYHEIELRRIAEELFGYDK